MTCMVSPLLHDIGKQRHEAGALDRVRQGALVLGGYRRDAAGHDLAALGDVTLQELHVLVVDLGRTGAGERIGLLAAEEGAARAVFPPFTSAASAFAVAVTAAPTV